MLGKLKPFALGLVGAVMLTASAGLITAQFTDEAGAVQAPVILAAAGEADLSALRVVETGRVKPDYAVGSQVPASLSLRRGQPVAAIVGGREATLLDVPGAVLIQMAFADRDDQGRVVQQGFGQCTGAIYAELGPRYVVTAAHCVLEQEGQYDRFDIWYGAGDGTASRETMKRSYGFRALVSPGYDPDVGVTYGEDVALIELVEPVDLAPHQMARLATRAEYQAIKSDTDIIVAGWGSTKGDPVSGRMASPVLKMANMNATRAGLIKITVQSPTGLVEGACQGDSGGSARLASDPRVAISVLSYVIREGGGVCLARGFQQTFTAAPLIRLAVGLN